MMMIVTTSGRLTIRLMAMMMMMMMIELVLLPDYFLGHENLGPFVP